MKLECEVQGIADVGRSRTSAQSIRRGRVAYGGHRQFVTGAPACISEPEEHPRPARISLYFLKRCAAGESMEAALSNRTSHSDTVNMLSKLRSCLVFGTRRSRYAVPRPCLARSKDAVGGGFDWPWAASLLSSWRMKAFAAAVQLAMRMPAAPCRACMAESHSLDGLLL